ncbi:uncharacterized protein LOC130440813 isoform X1 [Diorhabda sublineata]|uniref:uncharacterized protein LOC130440813 isoform X1 n=1 Tax=Diorhabda sublineata TaxID=1163346 RepID=UPI0024E0D442|nr:uncharacterized protein LOC130440813 isoform X1 [Diorhabda sublineata]
MSSVTKSGSSRIPTFGSRTTQPDLKPPAATGTHGVVGEITTKHIGNRVRIGDKEGILRFVGDVHFSKGVWCGIELSTSVGKNDGFINGVRYFACPDRCGLMAPLAKVSLINNTESIEHASGPYSMLFFDALSNRSALPLERTGSHEELITRNFKKRYIFSVENKVSNNSNVTYIKEDLETKKCLSLKPISNKLMDNNKKRTTDIIKIKEESTADNTNIEDKSNYVAKDKACESILKNSSLEVKRRRTSTSKIKTIDSIVLRSLNENMNKPSSLPQLKCINTPINLGKLNTSTSERTDTESPLKLLRLKQDSNNDDDSSKRDSLEFDESLGILTPDEMCSQFLNSQTRSPSLEYDKNTNDYSSNSSNKKIDIDSPKDDSLGLIDEKLINLTMHKSKLINLDVPQNKEIKEELQSPNLTDYSLGIIDDHILSNLTMKTDTTVNMELPLDIEKSALTRMEQTPSPEELPLDPTPIVECDPKTEPTKSKASNSFINSITSITSLDTGYQGDGEMSRPASRGADNSPLTRRPLPRPQTRRADPMTDSDFYTESDADNHEENHLRGDRKAQVIDGTLYGVDPQAAADIYVNNKENMDSSGIFTDIETNTRNDDDFVNIEVPDISPSDTSSKTISENSQDNVQRIIDKSKEKKIEEKPVSKKDNSKKRNAPSPGISSPSSFSSPRHGVNDDNSSKKYKMPKREIPSKVRALIEPSNDPAIEKKIKKPVGRWDAVMSKISKNEQNKTNLKDVKSKVFNSVNINTGVSQRKTISRSPGNPNSKLHVCSAPTSYLAFSEKIKNVTPAMKISRTQKSKSTLNERNALLKNPTKSPHLNRSSSAVYHNVKQNVAVKTNPTNSLSPVQLNSPRTPTRNNLTERRRIRNRPNSGSSPKTIAGSHLESSIHSSLSDVSAATLPPTNKSIGSVKKRADVVQVTQVLTTNKVPTRIQQSTAAENKKNAIHHSSPTTNTKARRTIFSPKEKKPLINKECVRGTVKGGRTSPTVRPPATIRVPPVKQPPVAEALAVLVQHLVFNVQAFQVPILKGQVERFHKETEELKLACQQLEDALTKEKIQHTLAIEVIEKHRNEISELNQRHAGLEQRILKENENALQALCKQQEEQLATVKKEFEKLQRTHEESLDILREENDSIREQIDEKRMEVEKVKYESKKLKDDYETKEILLKEHNYKLKLQLTKLEGEFEQKLKSLSEENKRLREENDRLLSYGDDKGISIQEVQSLRAVLELKQNEVAELRKSLAETNQRAEMLIGAEEKARVLNARCEDLQLQLERKADTEKSLIQENHKLQESFKEETIQKRRLSQYNEELQWKLKQNKEVINKVLERAEETVFNRSMMSSSFNERHNSTRLSLERAMSFRERTYTNRSNNGEEFRGRKSFNVEFETDDLSPPASPKVKAIVEKSDSVSYVLEMDESPEVVASRIVRRSFRNTTPSKNTPTKSPSNKRPRIRNPLNQSSSSSAILTTNKNELDRPCSANSRNGDSDNDIFMWSTNGKYDEHQDESYELSNSCMKLEDHDHLDLDEYNDDDLRLPALPSELDRRSGVQALPSPKHLAGEAMISESNSEDESTSSSQL